MKNRKRVPKFQTFTDKAGFPRWRLVAGNGKVLASGEAHTRKRDVHRAIEAVIRAAKSAIIEHVED